MDRLKAGTSKGYRRDIDGLRAIAVLAVVAFHAGLHAPDAAVLWVRPLSNRFANGLARGLPGGFVGVDIFFVISGFLIGGILLREQASGTFSIARFYERRIRRIVPALSAVLLFTFAAGWFALTPAAMDDLGRSTLAASLSAANIYFLRTSGYFDAPALQKPLLHMWSLAVEEQFYLVFPLVLMLIHRFGRRHLKVVLVVLFAVSFAASEVGVYRDPLGTFYLPQTRAWELLLGTLLAAGIVPPLRSALGRNLASTAGLACIAFASIAFTETVRFPGAAALWPCIGAALILAAGEIGGSAVGRLLSTRPFVFVGLISYSLYLWHWPLIVINKYDWFQGVPERNYRLLPVTFAVATLSWLFVERPFRYGALKLTRGPLFAAAGAATLLIAALAGWDVVSKGLPLRLTPAELSLVRQGTSVWQTEGWGLQCFASEKNPAISPSCLEESSASPNYLLYGDSHAAHLLYGLQKAYPDLHWLQATGSNCRPLLRACSRSSE
jgi:peptidoglycan/LPS O-acetylase OafA/YrhL